MSRNELIERWKLIVRTVFVAEDKIFYDWKARLEAARSLNGEEANAIADEYCEAVAKEIVDKNGKPRK